MNFSEDTDVGILDLLTKFELDRFIKNRDLFSGRKNWKHTHKRTETDTLPIIIGERVE